MIKKIFFRLKTLNKYRQFKKFIKLNLVNPNLENIKKKDIVLFEFVDMCSTHIAYFNLIKPITKIYNSKPYAISTALSSKKKYYFIKLSIF